MWSEAIRNKSLNVEEQLKIKDNSEKFLLLVNNDWVMELNSVSDNAVKENKFFFKVKKDHWMKIFQHFSLN